MNGVLDAPPEIPLLLKRVRSRPAIPDGIQANMTVVTTQGNKPEMHDQIYDATAPRNDR